MLIEKYLEVVVKQRGSDLHISAGLPPVVRIDGNLQRMDVPALKPEEVELLLFPMLNKEQRRKLEQDWELDFSYGIQGLSRFRVNIYKDRGNYAAAFRVIASKVPSFKELGLSDTVRKIAEKTIKWKDNLGKIHKEKVQYENGYVEEMEISPKDISAFSTMKSVRLIGIGKNLYPLTLKSWKQVKKELAKTDILQKLNCSKAS